MRMRLKIVKKKMKSCKVIHPIDPVYPGIRLSILIFPSVCEALLCADAVLRR